MTDLVIPPILRPRLWRPILIFPKGPAPVIFGPGHLSSAEALHWITNASKSGRYGSRGWRQAIRAVALSAPVPILDAPRIEIDRMRRRYRDAVIETAMSRAIADSGPPLIYKTVLEALPTESGILQTLVLGLPGVTQVRAREAAAVTLIGLGRPTQKFLTKRTWPKNWLMPGIRLNVDGLAIAALLDWRTTQGSWPDATDPVGERYKRRLWRAHMARSREEAEQRLTGTAASRPTLEP